MREDQRSTGEKYARRLIGSVSRLVVPESECNELKEKRRKGIVRKLERRVKVNLHSKCFESMLLWISQARGKKRERRKAKEGGEQAT